LLELAVSEFMRERSYWLKAGMLETVDSKSKSKPSIMEVPKERGEEELEE
jgi:hypothetical protein